MDKNMDKNTQSEQNLRKGCAGDGGGGAAAQPREPQPGLFLLSRATAAETERIAAVSSLLSFHFFRINLI